MAKAPQYPVLYVRGPSLSWRIDAAEPGAALAGFVFQSQDRTLFGFFLSLTQKPASAKKCRSMGACLPEAGRCFTRDVRRSVPKPDLLFLRVTCAKNLIENKKRTVN